MPTHITGPTVVAAAGNKPKEIREYIGRVNSADEAVSVAHMKSPPGWTEPGQRPDFDEYTVVLRGELVATTESGEEITVKAGEALVAHRGEWIQYATPGGEGAEYIAVCCPAFTLESAHRDSDE